MKPLTLLPCLVLPLATVMLGAEGAELLLTQQPREVAFTIDDLPVVSNIPRTSTELLGITARLVAKLTEFQIPAYGFVIGENIQSQGPEHLQLWLDAGFELGNHSYSHPDANAVGAAAFNQNILAGDDALTPYLPANGQVQKYFRFPMLRRGNNLVLKETIADFLTANDYLSAPVSIDNQDWLFNRAYERAIATDDQEVMAKIGTAYVDYLATIFAFFEAKSLEVLAYEPKQILLLHANALNAEYLDEIAQMLTARGYQFISLEDALTDPVYSYPEQYIGNRGLSWIHRVTDSQGLEIEMEPNESAWLEGLAPN